MVLRRGDLVALAQDALGRELLALLQVGQLDGLVSSLVTQHAHVVGDLAVLV